MGTGSIRSAAIARGVDLDRYRLRRFVERLIDMGEVYVRDEPVPLTALSEMIEASERVQLFRSAGPERVEIVAKTAGSRRRLAAAFDTAEDQVGESYLKRLSMPQAVVEIPSSDAPVHQVVIAGSEVDLTKLPFHPQHA